MRRLAPFVALVLLVALPPAATAGERAKKDKGGVPRDLGLTKKERRALDIASTRVYAEEGLGLVAVVKFKGNVEKLLGRGHLKTGAVAMVVHAKPGKGKDAGLVSKGNELTDEVLRKTKSETVGAVRDGKEVTFFIKGPGAKSAKSIEVTSFARDPRRGGARKSQELGLGSVGPFADDATYEADEEVIEIDISELSCEELGDLLDDLIDAGEEIQDDLDDAFDDLEGAKSEAEREDIRDEIDELRDEQEELGELFVALAEEYNRRCPGSVPIGEVLTGVFEWEFFPGDPLEVILRGMFSAAGGYTGGPTIPYAAAPRDPITAVKVVVPPAGNTPRQITNMLCPQKLPNPQVTTTTNPNDTLVCSGGSLPVGESFTLNVRTNPAPSAGMGGQISGQQAGAFSNPFNISGP